MYQSLSGLIESTFAYEYVPLPCRMYHVRQGILLVCISSKKYNVAMYVYYMLPAAIGRKRKIRT